MSIQVNLRALPSRLLEDVYKPENLRMARTPDNFLTTLSFPKSKAALWDPTPNGDGVSLHLSYYRNPRLLLSEKALRLAHRHARQSNKPGFSCFLLGTIAVDTDEEGVTVTLDRFDPGREQPGTSGKVPSALLPGDVLVPCVFVTRAETQPADTPVHSTADLHVSFQMLHHTCSSREPVDLARLLCLRAHLSCSQQADSLGFQLHWAAVTSADTLDAVPIRSIPVIPTALARNLSSQASLAQPIHSANRKRGFLTMDQTRKLLLILESDPKAYTLPVVGVWLSGITHISNPQVWAWCLRFLFSSSLQDRVLSEDGCFLAVLYSLTHREPEFYQCQAAGGHMTYQLLTSTQSLTLYKDVEVTEGNALQFELSAECQNQETELFREVLSQAAPTRAPVLPMASPHSGLSISDQDSGVEDEDLSPRPSPNPHPLAQQARRVHPSVPELSLVMDGSFVSSKRIGSPEPGPAPSPHHLPPQHGRGGAPPSSSRHLLPGQPPPPPVRPPLTPQGPLPSPRSSCGRRSAPFGQKTRSARPSSPSSSSPRAEASPGGSDHQPTRPAPPSAASPHHSPRLSPQVTPAPGPAHHHQPPGPAHHHQPPGPAHHHQPPGPAHHHNHQPPRLPHQPPPTHHLPPVHPRHFQSTPNSNVNQPCGCCSSPTHDFTPIYRSPGRCQGASVAPTPPYSHAAHHWDGDPTPPPPPPPPPPDCRSFASHQTHPQHFPGHSAVADGSHAQPHPPAHPPPPPPPHTATGHGEDHMDSLAPSAPSTCSNPCCRALAPPAGTASLPPQDGAMGTLPADAYQILINQDRQLKLLQAQIQMLLEVQGKAPPPPPPPSQQADPQSPAPRPPPAKTSVSVAVGTGASLFWGHPVEAPSPQERPPWDWHAESELPAPDGSRASCPPRGPADTEGGAGGSGSREQQVPRSPTRQPREEEACRSSGLQSPVLGESASMYYQSPPPRTTQEEEHKFYEDLLGQVNSRLQASMEAEPREEEEEPAATDSRRRRSLSPEASHSHSSSSSSSSSAPVHHRRARHPPAHDQVLSATLRQLQQLGVCMDSEEAQPSRDRRAVENASTLACIDPAAVLPRLSLPDSAGASLWCPAGSVDLSLEANAIALRYLSDSQLCRLSLGSLGTTAPQPSPASLLLLGTSSPHANASVFSPSNMSLATRKYMKRYGLIEEEEGEEEEDEEEEERDRVYVASQRGDRAQPQFGESKTPRGLTSKHLPRESPPRRTPLLPRSPPPRRTPLLPQTQQLDSQSQLLRDLRPKMQRLAPARATKASSSNKENAAGRARRWSEGRGGDGVSPQPEGSMGNFLDLSRLRQLPKLF